MGLTPAMPCASGSGTGDQHVALHTFWHEAHIGHGVTVRRPQDPARRLAAQSGGLIFISSALNYWLAFKTTCFTIGLPWVDRDLNIMHFPSQEMHETAFTARLKHMGTKPVDLKKIALQPIRC